MSVEALAPMDRAEAQRVTERIRLKLDSVASGLDALTALVADAYQRRADLALGYDSWAAYTDAEFSERTANLAAPIRRELVGRLTEAGMSTRAIAPVVGGSHMQVQRDRAAGVTERYTSTPDPDERVNPLTGEVIPAPTFKPMDVTDWPQEDIDAMDEADREVIERWEDSTVPKTVTGLDGKTYTRPEPKVAKPPRRTPLTDMFADVLYELDRRVESLARLTEDDRFPANREVIRLRSLAQAKKTATTLAGVLAAMENNNDSQKG